MMRMFRSAAWCAGVACLLSTQAWSATRPLSVQVKEGQLRATPSYLAKPVATVQYGDQVEEMEARGDWKKVAASNGAAGWIHESALTKKRIVLHSGDTEAQQAASSDELALAGRGFNADVEADFKAQRDPATYKRIDQLEKVVVSESEKQAFLKAGGVAPAQGGAR